MNEMVLRPAEGVAESQTKVDRMPWLERKQRGRIKAWFAMMGQAMGAPTRLMRSTPEGSSVATAWGYALLTLTLILLTGIGLPALIFSGIALLDGSSFAWEPILTGFALFAGGILFWVILLAVWGLVVHGILRITGGCAHSIGRTYQALCYSAGTLAPLGIPCVGPYCGTYIVWIWWVVSAILMITEGQRVNGCRATLAVLTMPIIMAVLLFGGYFGWIGYIMYSMNSGTGPFAQMGPMTADYETQMLNTSLITYYNDNNQWPPHALHLVADHFGAANFVSTDTNTYESDVPVGDQTLEDWQYLPSNRRQQAAQEIAEQLPENTIAYRLGDFVFTYPGIDQPHASSNLWTVIYIPDPDVNPSLMSNDILYAGNNNLGLITIYYGDLELVLEEQNQLRADLGLPPLPDPTTITHDAPAITEFEN